LGKEIQEDGKIVNIEKITFENARNREFTLGFEFEVFGKVKSDFTHNIEGFLHIHIADAGLVLRKMYI
jgi:hypothetical protein